jgi:hypothetical protein
MAMTKTTWHTYCQVITTNGSSEYFILKGLWYDKLLDRVSLATIVCGLWEYLGENVEILQIRIHNHLFVNNLSNTRYLQSTMIPGKLLRMAGVVFRVDKDIIME